MPFHKHTFPIRTINPDAPIEIKRGWRLDNSEYGFHNMGKFWVATELYSGLRICKQETRKACLEWIIENEDKIRNRMEEPLYAQRVCEFRELLRKERDKLNG